jgi:hypothetical protein
MATLTAMPGVGSASRAGPIGVSGEAAIAAPTARQAPRTVTAPALASDSAASRDRVIPRARRIGNSAASMITWRPSNCPMTIRVMIPARAANSASATA